MSATGWLLEVVSGAREFVHLLLEVAPFFLLGAVAGAALQVFVPEQRAARLLGGSNPRALFTAVAAGAMLPGCSCATIPMAAGLSSAGSPRLGTVAAFILVSPLLSPLTVALTWGMIGWEMTVARTAAALTGSVVLGVVINRYERWFRVGLSRRVSSAPVAAGRNGRDVCRPEHDCACSEPRPRFWPALRSLLRQITPYFLLGLFIAAALSAMLPANALPQVLGGSAGAAAYALAALVGIPLYVCEGEEVPITFALLGRGLGPGPSLTFLLGSVGTCIPTMLMARDILGQRATVFYLAYWFVFAIGSGVLLQLLLG